MPVVIERAAASGAKAHDFVSLYGTTESHTLIQSHL